MKCTEKEQLTCNVEKMGCEGCAYNDKTADEIEVGEYELTNLDREGYYVVKLKDGNSYRIYKESKKDYILKNNKKIYLSDKVRKAVLSNIREYERYGI